MIESLRSLLDSLFGDGDSEPQTNRTHALEVATAALMIEMARADSVSQSAEHGAIVDLLKTRFLLDDEETAGLVALATEKTDAAASLHEFTQVLHDRLRADEKLRLLEMLWGVALADQRADRHEEALIRKIGDLLYVPRSQQARIRLAALEPRGG
ncbi:MAG TPA: TerB family tellurite resistance protein [Gammaproteobacteria bacterium]|nr:TerB family tellurite resistance protein [Gammaproteobacteria bacterium]